MQAIIIRQARDLKPWEPLLRSDMASTPFSGWGFLEGWLETHSETSRPFIVVVTDARGATLAIAPWCITTENDGLRRLTGIGGTDGWYHDPRIFKPDCAAAIAGKLVEALRQARREWDFLDLLLRDAISAPLMASLKGLGPGFEERIDWRQQQTIRFTSDWSTYWSERPSQLRNLVSRRGKKLAARPHRFFQVDASTLTHYMERLFQLHRERWAAERDWKPYYGDIRAIVHDAQASGRLYFFGLEVEEQVVALELLIRCENQAFELMRITSGSAQEEALSPGSLLTAWALAQLIADGVQAVNLGPGIQPWKSSLETERTASSRCLVIRPSIVPLTILTRWDLLKPYLRSIPGMQRVLAAIRPLPVALRPLPALLAPNSCPPACDQRIDQGLS